MEERTLDVVAVGAGCIDLVLQVERLPGHDQKVTGRLVGRLPGGTVANFACAASRLGLRVGFLGSVGDDEAGRLVREDFRSFEVATDGLRVLPGQETQFTVILLDETGEKAIVVVSTYQETMELDAETRSYIAGARALYTMPYDLDQFKKVATAARALNTQVVIDVEPTLGASLGALKEILAHTDIAFFNREGLTSAMGDLELSKAAQQMLDYGPEVVVVTLGKEGCLVVDGDETVECAGFVVEVKDTTGAGDCFNAAFLAGYLWGWPLSKIATFANAAAALSVTKIGPRAGFPTVEAVQRFLREREAWFGSVG